MKLKRSVIEGILFIIIFSILFFSMSYIMGASNLLNTIMNTAYRLLMDTVFWIMAIMVLVGALNAVLTEFGVVTIIEYVLSPIMKPVFRMPGVASLAAVCSFLSDNSAIVSLAGRKSYQAYFKKYQLYSLPNFASAFGMGLVVITFMSARGYYKEAAIGLAGGLLGAFVSSRIMQLFLKNKLNNDWILEENERESFNEDFLKEHRNESVFIRFLNAILDGGKIGVDAGLSLIPGVLVIATTVMLLTYSVNPEQGMYTGGAYQGIPVLPAIGAFLSPVFDFLFGFNSPEAIAFPVTSLGSVSAALGLVDRFILDNLISNNDIAVFTAMGMCWSGFLSTFTGMFDALGARRFVGKAIISHIIGGITAGVFAHYLFVLITLWF